MPDEDFEWTPPPALQIAALGDDMAKVRELLAQGVDVNETDFVGKTALMVACKEHRHEIALLLLEKGADYTMTTNEMGLSAFHWACGNAHEDYRVVLDIIRRGVDINKPCSRGFTPLMKAVMGGDVPTAKLLVKYGADKTAEVPNPTFNEVLTCQNLALRIQHDKRERMAKVVALDAPAAGASA